MKFCKSGCDQHTNGERLAGEELNDQLNSPHSPHLQSIAITCGFLAKSATFSVPDAYGAQW